MRQIERKGYVDQLASLRGNGMIKVITGMRRCGKSYLLFRLFSPWLEESGVGADHIIKVNLEDYRNRDKRDASNLYAFIESRMRDDATYYILIDEVQMAEHFEEVLGGLLGRNNTDIYVTGSNARLLSKDVITEFRGRGFELRLFPLSFREYMSAYKGGVERGLNEYMLYGSLPQILSFDDERHKASFLKSLFEETYLTDIKQRYSIRKDADLDEIVDILASDIGSLTNPNNLANTLRSKKKSAISYDTVKRYIDYLGDAFLIERAARYDVKGRQHVNSTCKYYFMDMGLRNARLNFRQPDGGHVMENVIYNELRMRGFNVDVGSVPLVVRGDGGKQARKTLEVDFVCNMGSKRYYIQVAYQTDTAEKRRQEREPLLRVRDSFKKIIITATPAPVTRDTDGITTMSVYDFLLSSNSLEL